MKKIVFLLALVSFLNIFLFSGEKRFALGIKAGYSLGLLEEYKKTKHNFDVEYEISYKKLGLPAGIYCQYMFSPHFAVQVEYDYQRKTHYSEFYKYNDPNYKKSHKYDDSRKLVYVSGIYRFRGFQINKFVPYLSLGYGLIGFFTDPFVFVGMFRIGGGVRYCLAGNSFLNTNISLHILTIYWYPAGTDYLSFTIGFEQEF